MRRRRRRDYTPEQEAARRDLQNAEIWLQVVSKGIGATLSREYWCGDGVRQVINIVNTDLVNAANALDIAQKEHDKAFDRPGRAASTVVISGRPGKNPPRKGKKKSVPSLKPKQKGAKRK